MPPVFPSQLTLLHKPDCCMDTSKWFEFPRVKLQRSRSTAGKSLRGVKLLSRNIKAVLLQWLKKLVHIWQFFPCKANCGSDNKAKLVGVFCNKAKYCGPVCTKCQNISFMYWFNTALTMTTTQWTSFCALWNFWVCHRYHMAKPSISCKYVLITSIAPTSIITPPINMSTVSNQTILTLLQNGYSWHKGTAQTHVSHSTVRRHYSIISYTLPRQCVGHPARHSAQGQKPLVHKITSGAAHTATELKETLDMSVCVHTIKDTLKQEGLVSKVKANRPVPSKTHQSIG